MPRPGDEVDEAHALDDRAVGRVVAVAEELEPRAHREHHGAARVRRGRPRSRRAHALGGHELRVVLAAAEQVDVERIGDRARRRRPRRAPPGSRATGSAGRARSRSHGRRTSRGARGRRGRPAPPSRAWNPSPGARSVIGTDVDRAVPAVERRELRVRGDDVRLVAGERSARRATGSASIDRSTSAYRRRTATSSARSPEAATGWPRNHSYGTSHSHDGSLPSATCAFTAIVTPAPDRCRDVTERLGPPRRVLRRGAPSRAARHRGARP